MGNEQRYILVSNDENDWVKNARFVNDVLRTGRGVLWAQRPFIAKTDGAKKPETFPSGSFIVPFGGPFEYRTSSLAEAVTYAEISQHAKASGLLFHPFSGDLGADVARLRPARVALSGDGGSVYPFAAILAAVGVEYAPITGVDIKNGGLSHFDVLVLPGGGAWGGFAIQTGMMGDSGRRKVREWLHHGGAIWGSCAGCCNLVRLSPEASKMAPDSFASPEAPLPRTWPNAESLDVLNAEFWSSGWSGVGKLVVKNLRKDHPVMFGLPEEFEMTWHLGPVINPTPGRVEEASDPIPLLQMKGATDEWTSLEYAYDDPAKQREPGALDRTYIGRGIAEGRMGVITGYYGLGKVCGSGGHPEFGMDWLLEKWGQPARMICNFVFWAVSKGAASQEAETKRPELVGKADIVSTVNHSNERLRAKLAVLSDKVQALQAKPLSPLPSWLAEGAAEATFGLSPREKWPLILKRLGVLPKEIEEASLKLEQVDGELSARLAKVRILAEAKGGRKGSPRREIRNQILNDMMMMLSEELLQIDDTYNYERPDEWRQDFGWQGAIAQVQTATDKVQKALTNYNLKKKPTGFNPEAPLHPMFLGKDDSPHDLVWGWYLGGIYNTINALTVVNGRLELARSKLWIADQVLRHLSHTAASRRN